MFKLCSNAALVFTHLVALGMQNPNSTLENMTIEQKTMIAKEIAEDFLLRNTDFLVRTGSSSHHVPDDIDRRPFIKSQIDQGVICFYQDRAALCAANLVIIADLIKHKEKKAIKISPKKIDDNDPKMPAITAITCSKMYGEEEDQIILGGLEGRVFVADPKTDKVKTLGSVKGRVNSIECDPKGKYIALKFASHTNEGIVPCLALSVAYMKAAASESKLVTSKKSGSYLTAEESRKKNRRSWAPTKDEGWDYSKFVSQPCEHEVAKIWFDGEHCVTQCSYSNKIEKWMVKNPELRMLN